MASTSLCSRGAARIALLAIAALALLCCVAAAPPHRQPARVPLEGKPAARTPLTLAAVDGAAPPVDRQGRRNRLEGQYCCQHSQCRSNLCCLQGYGTYNEYKCGTKQTC